MSTPRSRRPRRPHGSPAGHPARAATSLAFCLLLVLGLALAGCGSSGEEATTQDTGGVTTTAPAATGDSATDEDRQAFADCLAEQGVELPEGGFPGAPDADGGTPPSLPEGGDPGAMQDAMAACGDLLPAGGPSGDLPEVDQEALRVYTSCLEDHGVTLPTFGAPGDGPPTTGDDSTAPTLDPDTVAAQEACAPLAPEGFDPADGGGFPGGPPGAPDTDTTTDSTTDEANS